MIVVGVDGQGARHKLAWQLLRYVMVGGVLAGLTAMTYLIPAILFGVPPLVANFMAYLVAVCVGFVLHSRLSFGGYGTRDRPGLRVGRFFAVSLVSLVLNSLFVEGLTGLAGLSPWWPIVPMLLVTPLVSFALNRQWVFQ